MIAKRFARNTFPVRLALRGFTFSLLTFDLEASRHRLPAFHDNVQHTDNSYGPLHRITALRSRLPLTWCFLPHSMTFQACGRAPKGRIHHLPSPRAPELDGSEHSRPIPSYLPLGLTSQLGYNCPLTWVERFTLFCISYLSRKRSLQYRGGIATGCGSSGLPSPTTSFQITALKLPY